MKKWDRTQGFRLAVVLAGVVAVVVFFVDAVPPALRFAVFFGVCVGVLGLQRWQPHLFEGPKARVEVDKAGVRRYLGEQMVEQVTWAELTQVSIMTTDEGPFSEDFFWLFYADGHGCAIGQGLAMPVDLLGRLQKLPGFDNLAVISASCSTDWQEFICWQGKAGDALVLASDETPERSPAA